MFPVLKKHHAAAGYKGPVKIKLLKGEGLLLSRTQISVGSGMSKCDSGRSGYEIRSTTNRTRPSVLSQCQHNNILLTGYKMSQLKGHNLDM